MKLAWVMLLSAACTAAVAKEGSCELRGGLPNACRIWKEGKAEGTIFYIGGTLGNAPGGTRDQLSRIVKKVLPAGKGVRAFCAWNRSYPDNCSSVIETFRSMSSSAGVSGETVYPYVAITVIDLSADDIGMPAEQVQAALEGMIFRTRKKNPTRDMVMLYQADDRFVADYRAGKVPEVIRMHEAIGAHYGIPSVNLAKAASAIADWKGTKKERDALLCQQMERLLSQCAAQAAGQPVRHPCPKPMAQGVWDRATLVNYDRGEMDLAGWLGWQLSPVDQIFHVATCSKPGPAMSVDFTGTAVGVYGVTGADAGDLDFSIDGGPWQALQVFDRAAKDGGYHLFHRMFADQLADTKHTVRLRVAEAVPPGSKGRQARVGWFTVNGNDASPMGTLKPIELADSLFLQLEPLGYAPPKTRWQLIPKTMRRLREGGTLRMVMLGDSIVNNIQSSGFNLLVERAYPGSKIEKIVCVRGSTGCWYYQEPEHLKEYVLRHKPDLLVIGGISQRGDVEAIRSVIRQTRAALPEVEVIVMTDVFGSKGTIDPYDPKTAADPDPNGTGYRDRLYKMAMEERVEYINLTQPWARFLAASKQPLGAFMSDAVHANARGCQLVGRLLELYFAPDGWDARKAAEKASGTSHK